MLYFRMIFIILVSLYTSRVVLNTLGVADYGLFNVVGGIVVMFSFLNSGMIAACQRFIAYELGKNNLHNLKKVFTTSITIHIVIALFILIVAETAGLWFLNEKMNIAPQRMIAANWVYQCSILAFIVNIISVPYNSCIVAHEHMKAYAYVSILEVMLKLLIVFALTLSGFDKLITYAILTLAVSIITCGVYAVYCRRHFQECCFQLRADRYLFGNMMGFAGWSFIGNLGFSVKNQGINILINLFFNTVINAARGIAYQVVAVISGFVNNFQMAMNPPITKFYAGGDIASMMNLVCRGAKYSFFLLYIISLPVLIRTSYILTLWLKIIPEYTVVFLQLAIGMSLIDSMAGTLTTAMQATGKIRNFQIVISLVMFLNLPLCYLFLKSGYGPVSVMWVAIFTSFLGLGCRLWLLNRLIPFPVWSFIRTVVIKNISIFFVTLGLLYFISFAVPENFIGLLVICLCSVVLSFLSIYFIALDKAEKDFCKRKLKWAMERLNVINCHNRGK